MNRSRWPATACILTLWTVSLFAQTTTGTILGSVSDPSGASVEKAKVTVRSRETNALRTVLTEKEGEYTVPLLPPGFYEVTVEMPGFRRSVQKDIKLDVDQILRLDIDCSSAARPSRWWLARLRR